MTITRQLASLLQRHVLHMAVAHNFIQMHMRRTSKEAAARSCRRNVDKACTQGSVQRSHALAVINLHGLYRGHVLWNKRGVLPWQLLKPLAVCSVVQLQHVFA